MNNPFPGMDPYLEQRWGDVHTKLTAYTADELNARLPADLVAMTTEYVTLEATGDVVGHRSPDVGVVEYPPEENGTASGPAAGGVVVATPVLIAVPAAPRTKRRVEIYDTKSGNRIVTAIEFLSHGNKVGDDGRATYHKKRREFLAAGVSVVEIDLLRGGDYVLYPEESSVPVELRGPYRVCVVRGWSPTTAEYYHAPLREPLPTIRVPLRSDDPDATLGLQELIDTLYRKGRYPRILDYTRELSPALPPDDAAWVDERLRAAGKR